MPQVAPECFYPDQFGLWSADDPRVEYHCEMVLQRLQREFAGFTQPGRRGRHSSRTLLKALVEWDIDRCLCDGVAPDAGPRGPKWDGAKYSVQAQWHTEDARRCILADNLKEVIFEHAIPRVVVFDSLVQRFQAEKWSRWEQVRDFLAPRRGVALVTKSEDARLRSLGLQSQMPAGWQDPAIGNVDAGARYRAAEILLCPPEAPLRGEVQGGAAPIVQPAGQAPAGLGRVEKLAILNALFAGNVAGLEQYCRVGGDEDREFMAEGEGTAVPTDCVALLDWLPAPRQWRPPSLRTDGFATGLPFCVAFEVTRGADAKLQLHAYRTPMTDADVRVQFSEALRRRRIRVNGQTEDKSGFTLKTFPIANQDPVAVLRSALTDPDVQAALAQATEAMREVGWLP